MKFYVASFISCMALLGVSTTLATYVNHQNS